MDLLFYTGYIHPKSARWSLRENLSLYFFSFSFKFSLLFTLKHKVGSRSLPVQTALHEATRKTWFSRFSSYALAVRLLVSCLERWPSFLCARQSSLRVPLKPFNLTPFHWRSVIIIASQRKLIRSAYIRSFQKPSGRAFRFS